ncbi:hypothetical protein H7X46_06475 [Pseudonocardia sp. C8]|uniref:hypothetical protein n=1 Tax=Pseudonocardia sp. C8 TaxID=2762759 RepID=UPI001642F355|nr:hypothetical protein [Pseudonocardia sp. C8]MBC3190702.1 hypothetical protein [Pseudonocardia sp. C8]
MTSDLGHRAGSATTAELRTAAALRWQRPLLTAELAEHASARAVADGDDLCWLLAAGWLIDGHAAGGDARDVATAVLGGLTGTGQPDDAVPAVPRRPPGPAVLGRPEAARLRVELAAIAQADGELDTARALVADLPDDAPGEEPGLLRLDRLAVEVRCALAAGDDPGRPTRELEAWASELRGDTAAFADLVVGSVHRARREHGAAVERALHGLAELGWTPDRPDARPLSAHLAAALLSQWITALLDGGRSPAEAVRAASAQHAAVDAGRQGVLLRLTLTRAEAGRVDRAARALADAAASAEAAGVPALVAACRTAQSELHEGAGRYREALEAMRAAVAADQRDRDRGRRFRHAVAAMNETVGAGMWTSPGPGSTPVPAPVERRASGHTAEAPARRRPERGSHRRTAAVTAGREPATTTDTGRPDRSAAGPGQGAENAAAIAGGEAAGTADGAAVHAEPAGHAETGRDGNGRAGAARTARRGTARAAVAAADGPGFGTVNPSSTGRELAIDPDDPLGVSAMLAGASDDAATMPGGDSGPAHPAGRSWSVPSAATRSGSPLADALIAELRNGDRARVQLPSTGGTRTADERPRTDRRLPGAGAPQPERAEPTIVVEVLDGAGAPVHGDAVTTALEEIALRSRRLVPPTGSAEPGAASVRVTLPGADRVTVLLWARSLAAHLAERLHRGGLPDGAALRLRATGTQGDAGDEIVRELTGPDAPPPGQADEPAPAAGGRAHEPVRTAPQDEPAAPETPDAVAAGRCDEEQARRTPVAGPAMAVTPDLSVAVAGTRAGRRRAADGEVSPVLAAAISARPARGGRRRADEVRRTDGSASAQEPTLAPGADSPAPVGPAIDTTAADTMAAGTAVSGAAAADAAATDTAATGAAVTDSAAADSAAADSAPADTAPADTAPADTAPADTAPADTAPADTAPADTAATDSAATGAAPTGAAAADISATDTPVAHAGSAGTPATDPPSPARRSVPDGPAPDEAIPAVPAAGGPAADLPADDAAAVAVTGADTPDAASDRRLAEAVRAHLDLSGAPGANAGDGMNGREGRPVMWSSVSAGAGPAALPKRNGRSRAGHGGQDGAGAAVGSAAGTSAADGWAVRSSGAGVDLRTGTAAAPDRASGDRAARAGTTEGGPGTGPDRGANRASSAGGSPPDEAAAAAGGSAAPGDTAASADRPAAGEPDAIPEDMGLADLLAGALAAYREI